MVVCGTGRLLMLREKLPWWLIFCFSVVRSRSVLPPVVLLTSTWVGIQLNPPHFSVTVLCLLRDLDEHMKGEEL